MTRVSVPEECDERQFHDLACAVAEAILTDGPVNRLDPFFSEPRDLRLFIKGKVIDHLPSEYVEITPYVGWQRFRASGRHRFLKPIPKAVMLAAFKDAGFEWSPVAPMTLPEPAGSTS